MNWTLAELKKFEDEMIPIDTILDVKSSLMNRDSEILDVSPIHITGFLAVNPTDYILSLTIMGQLTVPSSRSLKPAIVEVNKDVQEVFMTEAQLANNEESVNKHEIMLIEDDTLDIVSVVEDHLILEIPFQVLTEAEKATGEMPKGSFWEVVSEEDYLKQKQKQKETKIDSRLAKLSEFVVKDDDSQD